MLYTTQLSKGVSFHSLYDNKYKTEYFNVFFKLELNDRNATLASLVSRILQRGSSGFPTMKKLSEALDENYSATLGASGFKCSDYEVFSLNLSSLKDTFALKGEGVFERGIAILSDMLFSPLLEDGIFKKEYFESEKQNLIDSINSQINNKAAYSRSRFIANMFEGESFGTNGEGSVAVAEKLTNREAFDFYKNVILSSPVDIFYVGEKKPEEVIALLSDFTKDRSSLPLAAPAPHKKRIEVKRAVEDMDIAQSHLWLGYNTGITYDSENYLAGVLFNMVLGGDVTGKMFMNLREKMSLCYTCHSSLDASKGILSAYAGISPKNVEKTEKAFYEQLDKIKAGDLTDEEISDGKKSFANRMREIMDDPSLLATWFFIRLAAGAVRHPEEDARNIEKITRDDIVSIANGITLDTVYLLSGKEKD